MLEQRPPSRPSGRLSFAQGLAEKIAASPYDFVLTGGSGWIGQATTEMLESVLGDALTQRLSVFGSSDRVLNLRSGRALPCRELKHIEELDARPKIFIHCAFLTKDRLSDQSVENFVAANNAISDRVAAAVEKSDARGFFAPSSGAVYQKNTHVLEQDVQRNAYGVMKIADEKRFLDLAQKKKIPISLPRLFNLSGPFINKHELYALASMIKAVQDGLPIVIRAPHRVVRSYVHVADLVSLAFSMLLDPKPDDEPVFDTAGEDNLELGELASAIREALGQTQLNIERPQPVDGKDDIYVGEASSMRRMMLDRGFNLIPLRDQIRGTADFMQELKQSSPSHQRP